MAAGNVPTTNINALYTNTTAGTAASPTVMDAAIADIVATINDNYAYAAGLVQADKLSDMGIVNVKDYGALGDGSNDDTAEIQAALDAVPSGGILFFPDGEYKITSTLQVNNPITIMGSGQYTTQLTAVGCSAIQINKDSYVSIRDIGIYLAVRYTTTPNSLTGIIIDGDTATRPFNHVYRDIYIDGFEKAISANYLWSTVFDNVKCNNGHIGLYVTGLSVNNVVTNCSLETDATTGSRGIYFVGDVASEGWMINGTLINDCEIGIQGTAMTHVYVTNCILDHNTVNGILIINSATNFAGNWDISGCYIAMTGTGGDSAIKNADSLGSASQNRGCRIRGNDILVYSGGACNYGIYMSGSQAVNNVIIGNNINGFTQSDIRTLSTTDVISHNVCLTSSPVIANIRGACVVSDNIGTVYYQRAQTFSKIGSIKITYDEAVPTTGSWTRGDICYNITPAEAGTAGSKYIVTGWIRRTTGSGNVLNTDWFEMRALTGN